MHLKQSLQVAKAHKFAINHLPHRVCKMKLLELWFLIITHTHTHKSNQDAQTNLTQIHEHCAVVKKNYLNKGWTHDPPSFTSHSPSITRICKITHQNQLLQQTHLTPWKNIMQIQDTGFTIPSQCILIQPSKEGKFQKESSTSFQRMQDTLCNFSIRQCRLLEHRMIWNFGKWSNSLSSRWNSGAWSNNMKKKTIGCRSGIKET